MFSLNQELVDKAKVALAEREQIFWIIGGSCSGKSTIAQTLCGTSGATLYDMDEKVFGHYMSQYRLDRHPASKRWFWAENPLAWSLSLSWEDFDGMYRAANAEYLDLLADELSGSEKQYPLIVDGGITHPSVLAQAIPSDRILCLEMPEVDRVRIWESSQERAEMRGWIHQLPEAERMWQKFLTFDRNITQTISRESRENGIQCIFRDGNSSVEELAEKVATCFGLRDPTTS